MPRGGKRPGAGRPRLGITKKVSLTLTAEEWEKIGQYPTVAAFIKSILKENEMLKNQVTKIEQGNQEQEEEKSNLNQVERDEKTDDSQTKQTKRANSISPTEIKIVCNQIRRGSDSKLKVYLDIESVEKELYNTLLSVEHDKYICDKCKKTLDVQPFSKFKLLVLHVLRHIVQEKEKAHALWASQGM